MVFHRPNVMPAPLDCGAGRVDLPVPVGGIIPAADAEELRAAGVGRVADVAQAGT